MTRENENGKSMTEEWKAISIEELANLPRKEQLSSWVRIGSVTRMVTDVSYSAEASSYVYTTHDGVEAAWADYELDHWGAVIEKPEPLHPHGVLPDAEGSVIWTSGYVCRSSGDERDEARVEAERRWPQPFRRSDRLPIDWLNEGMSSGFVLGAQWQSARDAERIRELEAEAEQLRGWKAEARAVLGEWEQTWEAAGRPGALGASKAVSVREEIGRLRAAMQITEGDDDE